jgi:hypothetical protein
MQAVIPALDIQDFVDPSAHRGIKAFAVNRR